MTPELAAVIVNYNAGQELRTALQSIADEMALTITRTTYSGVLKDNMDFSTAFADANGKLVAQGPVVLRCDQICFTIHQ